MSAAATDAGDEGYLQDRNTMGRRMEHLQEIKDEWARLTMLTDMKRQMMQSHLHMMKEHGARADKGKK